MDTTYGCVFVEVAKKLSSNLTSGSYQYDWENKQTYPLSQEDLDTIIYTLSTEDTPLFTVENNNSIFSFSDNGFFSVTSKNTNSIVLSNDLSLVQVNGLRIMLEQAKIKTYGWN